CTVKVDGTRNVSVNFMQAPLFAVTTSGSGVGIVTSDPPGIHCGGPSGTSCMARFSSGTRVTLSATPSSGSGFVGWGRDALPCGYSPACVMTAHGPRPLAARCEPGGYVAWAIKVEAAGGRASIVRARTAPDSDIWIAGTYSGVGFLTNTMLAYSPSNVRALFVARLGPDGTVR